MGSESSKNGELIDILLVEPNPGDTRLFTEQFKEAKFLNDIHAVSDGETALDFLHQRGEFADTSQPDIIILEPELPGIGGTDVCSALQSDTLLREIPVIVLASSDAGIDILQSRDLDADIYLQKPMEPADFVEFVRSIEEFWLAIVKE